MGPFSGSYPSKEGGQYQNTTPCLPACSSTDTRLQGRLWCRSVKIGEWFSLPPSCSALSPSGVAAAHHDDARGAIRPPLSLFGVFLLVTKGAG